MPQELRKRHRGRTRRLKNLDERFEWYADAIESEPASCRGRWAEAHPVRTPSPPEAPGIPAAPNSSGTPTSPDVPAAPSSSETPAAPNSSGTPTSPSTATIPAREVRLDVGCGKGKATVESALAEPDVLFVGLDCEAKCIALAAQRAVESGARNVVFTLADAEDARELFADGELARITLAFPTPHPRKKHASERLTHVDVLCMWRELLALGGTVEMLTDSPMLWEWTIEQMDMAAYDIVGAGTSLAADGRPTGEWEERLVSDGASVHWIVARPGAGEVRTEQRVPASLFDWLGDDIDEMEYVPFGMGPAVEQFRAYKEKHGKMPPKSG